MGRLRAATMLLAALAAGLLLAACGGGSSSGELLPGTTADQINSNLDQVRESNAAGNCEEAEEAVAQVNEEIEALQKVNPKLKTALEEGATKLSIVVSNCSAGAEAEEAKESEEARAEEEAVQAEEEELQSEEEEKQFEKEQKEEEKEEKAQEKAEEDAEQPGPEEGEEEAGPPGKAKGHEKQEEKETPGEEVTPPPAEGGPAGGIGPGAAVEGKGP